MASFQSVRGMRDLLPEEVTRWQLIETRAREVLESFGYREIRIPAIEPTELFSRSVGESTDIVEKETYAFVDRGGQNVTLRPEGTAGCVRAGLQSGLIFNRVQRFWYAGPMFRYEKPQKGRYREFHQIGAESFGIAGPENDAELIQIGFRLFEELGVGERVTLELNTMGSPEARVAYRTALVAYLTPLRSRLDPDSQRRLERNPLRILDSKEPGTRALLEDAPALEDYLDEAGRTRFDELKAMLDALGIAYRVNPRLVRGLDYYTHTVFEWVTDALGAQGAVCGGGRYDGLVELLGGRPTPAAGFAIGTDRLAMLDAAVHGNEPPERGVDVYVVVLERARLAPALALAERMRGERPGLRVQLQLLSGKFENEMKRAHESGAQVALIVGGDTKELRLRWLRGEMREERLDEAAMLRALTRIEAHATARRRG